jgi:hypothetical protein
MSSPTRQGAQGLSALVQGEIKADRRAFSSALIA